MPCYHEAMTTFSPDPSPFRDYVEQKITFSEYAGEVGRPDIVHNPPPSSFEDWRDAARSWATENPDIDLMPFQVEDFADRAAWDGEGIRIKPDSMQKMWDHYLTGLSGGPHHVPMDGYDMDLWARGRQRDARRAMEDAIAERGVEEPEASRLVEAWVAWFEIGADDSAETIESFLDDWFSGSNSASPHYVPLEQEHHDARVAERERVMSMDCYRGDRSDNLRMRLLERLIISERPGFPKARPGSRFSLGRPDYRTKG